LREDIKAGAHAEMVPSQFQGTRAEYEEFDRDIFRQRIYQEERYQKYWNWLDDKRTEKQRAHKEQQEKKKVKEAEKQEKKKAKEEEKKRKAAEKKRKKEADKKRKADENKKKAREAKRMRVNK
jgi:membrane protein involved in colicin uptake